MANRNTLRSFAVILSQVAFVVVLAAVLNSSESVYDNMRLFSEVFSKIQNEYVEETPPRKLIYGALRGMVGTLDPFSSFMDTTTYKEMKVHTQGEFGGLGIRIAIKEEWLTVITPIPGTPAYKLGILPGDKIIKIEDESTKGISVEQAVDRLRGKPGTEVNITIYREGENEPLVFKVVRDIIKIETVKSRALEDGIGYIKLLEFSEKTPADTAAALAELSKKNIRSLIIDLRNNPGGLLDSAVDVCKFFIGEDKLVVYTQGRGARIIKKFMSNGPAKYPDIPLCVLINKGSASGSEIVSGCMKDHRRGIIIGETSFGKASVQSLIQLSDGSALRLTTAHYYTPNGLLIHEKGVAPDIKIDVPREVQIKLMGQEDLYFPESETKPAVNEKNKPKEKDKSIIEEVVKSKENKDKPKEKVEDAVLERAKDILRAREIFFSERSTSTVSVPAAQK